MKYIILLVLFFLIVRPIYSITKEEKKLFDTLFTTSIEEDLQYEEVENIIDLVANNKNEDKYRALYRFIEVSRWRSYAITKLIELKDTTSIMYCRKYKDQFYYSEWREIRGFLLRESLKKTPWKIKEFNKIFIDVLTTSKYEEVRREICNHFEDNALYKDLSKLREHLKIETNRFARMRIYSSHGRYSDSTTTKQILKWFDEFKEPDAILCLIESGIENNNRYDLIPELKKFKQRLKNIKDVTKVSDAERIVKVIDSVIPKLNRNKPAGKPLNWGLDY